MSIYRLEASEPFLEYWHRQLIPSRSELRLPLVKGQSDDVTAGPAIVEGAILPHQPVERQLKHWMRKQDRAMARFADRVNEFRAKEGRFPMGAEVSEEPYLMSEVEFGELSCEIRTALEIPPFVPITSGARYGSMVLARGSYRLRPNTPGVAIRWNHPLELLIHSSAVGALQANGIEMLIVPVLVEGGPPSGWLECVPRWVETLADIPKDSATLYKCPTVDSIVCSSAFSDRVGRGVFDQIMFSEVHE